MEKKNQVSGTVSRVLIQQPDRVAAAWRRVRFAEKKGQQPDNLLDDVVESFVREIGYSLAGAPGSAWRRTRGVLRLSAERGTKTLHEEFAALRRCLVDALEVLGGQSHERAILNKEVDQAVDSAVAMSQRLVNPEAPPPQVQFGGLVVEHYERPSSTHAVRGQGDRVPLH